jgi:hypothetical protein
MLKKIQYFVLFFLFHHFIVVNSQTSENNDCFEKAPKKLKNNNSKKSSLKNNLGAITSQEESLNSSPIDNDLISENANDLSDELLEEIQCDRQEILELDEYFDEDDLHQTSDVNFEDNCQSQNIYQELSESAQQQLTNNPNNNELKIEIDNHFRNETGSLEELLKINENFEIARDESDELPEIHNEQHENPNNSETETNSLEL